LSRNGASAAVVHFLHDHRISKPEFPNWVVVQHNPTSGVKAAFFTSRLLHLNSSFLFFLINIFYS
jgi:hypothetical protein